MKNELPSGSYLSELWTAILFVWNLNREPAGCAGSVQTFRFTADLTGGPYLSMVHARREEDGALPPPLCPTCLANICDSLSPCIMQCFVKRPTSTARCSALSTVHAYCPSYLVHHGNFHFYLPLWQHTNLGKVVCCSLRVVPPALALALKCWTSAGEQVPAVLHVCAVWSVPGPLFLLPSKAGEAGSGGGQNEIHVAQGR